MTSLVWRPHHGGANAMGRRVGRAESRPVTHPRDADSYSTSDVFSAAAAVARDSTMDSASDALAHQSTTDYTLNATVVTKPIGRLIRTNGDMSLIFYALFACAESEIHRASADNY